VSAVVDYPSLAKMGIFVATLLGTGESLAWLAKGHANFAGSVTRAFRRQPPVNVTVCPGVPLAPSFAWALAPAAASLPDPDKPFLDSEPKLARTVLN
jgi:hypothetical protein